MKKKLLLFSAALLGVLALIVTVTNSSQVEDPYTEAEALRAKHQQFLDNSPMNATMGLERKDRKQLGLPPNAYNEQMFNLTMDPALGYPVPSRTYETYDRLVGQFGADRSPGSATDNAWEERGPFNIGGRVRLVMFDPNDGTNKAAFAGGVSGGLYYNDDVTNLGNTWQLVVGVPGNIAVSSMTYDPNDPQIMFLGTGEQYTQGAANGNGIYKSFNGGTTWFKLDVALAGGGDTTAGGIDLQSGLYYVNDIIAWEAPSGTTHLYAGIGSTGYVGSSGGGSSSPQNVLGLQNAGLYRSTNGGIAWSRIEQPVFEYTFFGNTYFGIPNDFEISADNTLYFGGIRSGFTNAGLGGRIFKTTDGVSWSLAATLTASNRTQLAVSGTDPNVMYAAAQGLTGTTPVRIFKTDDAWATFTTTNLPNDVDTGIPANDYTRGQSFYNLMLAVDPTDDDKVYVGGIDMHRSINGGTTWTQISKWSNNGPLAGLSVPLVHADIHEMVFRPGFPDQSLTGTDGGVFYATSLAAASGSPGAIPAINRNLNVTQFYYGAINADDSTGDDLAGGTQDNGTLFAQNAVPGTNNFFDRLGGDGGFTEIDDGGTFGITSFPGNSHIFINYPVVGSTATGYQIDSGEGVFINQAELDKNLDILYANGQTGGNELIKRYVLGPASAVTTNLDNALIDNSAPTAFKVSPFTAGSTKLFVGTATGKLIRLDDADTTPIWTEITGPGFVGSVSDVEFGQTEDEIYVTFHNYGVDSVWQTLDGGATWNNKQGNLPDIPVKCFLQNPIAPTEVIIGTELGIWSTDDITAASPDWFPADNGMLDIVVKDLDLRVSDNMILASTHGRGMFTNKFSTLGIDELSNPLDNVVVFPTVSDGEINVQATKSFGETRLEVYSMTGQKLNEQTIQIQAGSPVSLNFTGMTSGVYFIKLYSGQLQTTKRFVIR
ncbi:MAG: T9SS type A sorting domain-containing protein [Gilvibacter sp.]